MNNSTSSFVLISENHGDKHGLNGSYSRNQYCLGDRFYSAAECSSITQHFGMVRFQIGIKTDKCASHIYQRELLWQMLSIVFIPLTDQMKKELRMTVIQT